MVRVITLPTNRDEPTNFLQVAELEQQLSSTAGELRRLRAAAALVDSGPLARPAAPAAGADPLQHPSAPQQRQQSAARAETDPEEAPAHPAAEAAVAAAAAAAVAGGVDGDLVAALGRAVRAEAALSDAENALVQVGLVWSGLGSCLLCMPSAKFSRGLTFWACSSES
jgi:hypothetical protein